MYQRQYGRLDQPFPAIQNDRLTSIKTIIRILLNTAKMSLPSFLYILFYDPIARSLGLHYNHYVSGTVSI